MLTKIYTGSWTVTLAAFVLLFATGNLTMLALVVFGFIAFGLTFMGMISVLPSTVVHSHHRVDEPVRQSLRGRLRDYKETLASEALAVRKPKFP